MSTVQTQQIDSNHNLEFTIYSESIRPYPETVLLEGWDENSSAITNCGLWDVEKSSTSVEHTITVEISDMTAQFQVYCTFDECSNEIAYE